MQLHTTLLCLLMACALGALAQVPTQVSGRVTDPKGRALAGANVSLKDSYDGATADSAGYYQFTTIDTGSLEMVITYAGYKDMVQLVVLQGKPLQVNATLREAPNELTAVVITAGSFEASDEKRTTVLKPLDIVTTASANADVAAAMRSLPGTQQVGESGELFVRGGAGYETRQFIDGMVVANPFLATAPDLAARGRFSPFLFKGTVFSTGGYSALYGQALSSALVLESIDLPDESEASLSLSPLFAGLQYQHLANNKKHSWGLSGGYTNLAPYFGIIKQRPDFFKAPELANADANLRIKTSPTGMLKAYVAYNRNSLGVRNPDIDSMPLKHAMEIGNHNLFVNMSYKERLANRLKMRAGLSLSYNTDDVASSLQDSTNQPLRSSLPMPLGSRQFTLQSTGILAQARLVLDYKLMGLSAVRWGAEHWYQQDQSRFQAFPRVQVTDHYTAAFGEADIYLSNRMALRAGLRGEHSALLEAWNVAPRASLSYQLAKGEQLTMDYGIFYQKPLAQYLLFERSLPQMRANHYILTYQKVNPVHTLRLQAFQKDYRQLVRTWPDTAGNGAGYARGVELFWRDKKTVKGVDYWITYSYLDTRRQYLQYPYALQPDFAANHTANLVVKRFFTKLNMQANLNYQYASGRPFYDIAYLPAEGKMTIRQQGRTIDFHNLSASVNYLTKVGKAFTVLVLSVSNVFNSTQVFNYRFSANGLHRVPVVPPARQFVFVGAFLSWGTDRRQDAINNNL